MGTIFMNSENSKGSKTHVLILSLTDEIDLRRGKNKRCLQIGVALSNISDYYTWKNIKISYNNNKFKISAPTWNHKLKLPDGLYSISDIQDFFQYIVEKHVEKNNNHSIRIYSNKIENGLTFKIKTVYYFELLTSQTMELLGRTEIKITKEKNDENVPHLEVT